LLTDDLPLIRVELARQLLELLEDQRIIGFSDIVTEDILWTVLSMTFNQSWIMQDEQGWKKCRHGRTKRSDGQ
jgi:hypothetical protein